MAVQVAGDQYFDLDGQLLEIKRQIRQPNGYPFDPAQLQKFLQRGIEGKFVEGQVVKPKPTPLLGKRTPVAVPEVDPNLDLAAFFKTKPGLYVLGDFVALVLQSALQTDRATFKMPMRMSRRQLNESAIDKDIEAKLGRGYLFSELDVAINIAKMIVAQPNGIAGPLVSDGKANLFYLTSCVVYVYWYAGASVPRWDLNACRRGGYRWRAGIQAFASN